MNTFGVDWSSGWAGNITSELVGLALGLFSTYVVVDRVVKWRLNERYRPMRVRLLRRLEHSVGMLASRWAASLRIENAYDVNRTSQELERLVRDELNRRLAPSAGETLDDVVQKNLSAAGAFSLAALTRLARGILEVLRDVSDAADRFAPVLERDPKLHSLVADLEETKRDIERELASLGLLGKVGFANTEKLGLLAKCRVAFDRGCDVTELLRTSR